MKRWMAMLLFLLAPMYSMAAPEWTTSWMAVPDTPGPAMQALSLRQVIRASVGGDSVRVRLSNAQGTAPLIVGTVRVARWAGVAAIEPGSGGVLTFAGQPHVTIAPGESVLSDPLAMPVTALQKLAVSLYLPQGSARATLHGEGLQTAYIARGADLTAAAVMPATETDDSLYFLASLEVRGASAARTIVVLGDSIADGVGSSTDAQARWPDQLAARLAPSSVAVLNAGVAGNRLLRDGARPFVGPSMLARLQRDVLDRPGVRWLVLHAGSNDINASDMLAVPDQQASAQDIIAGMQAVIQRAHAAGVKVCGATLLPSGGVGKPFVRSAEGEAKRQAVNAWIRSASQFDALVDFDLQLRDPARTDRLLPAYDSGDHLHPNDRGYQAMADAMPVLPL
ncbi:SGNH/GDSL hydrolase family protein [Duganella sp. FT80W]|uniref:SGNH/GDSL hydrolase family protein n=1 Tax=Duganella guangzhouensis TaxID=2666084 RepID=A0A6I2L8Y6_9BURK|nr:SGNH/GDSL hydrolase family protein [Duganella guangzhouensis]MRW92729.1 SGNH/GDSL hydrolase family protein [Duganella guangzhouensis]